MKINKISSLNGTIVVPADKSITHRSIMLSSIAEGKSYLHNYLILSAKGIAKEHCNHTLLIALTYT